MPSTRRQSLPSASSSSASGPSTPLRNPAIQALRPSSARPASPRTPRTPASTSSSSAPTSESRRTTRSTRSSSRTPQPQTPLSHHRTADELALEEGQELLSGIAPASARAQRHARLIEAREEAERAASLASGGETEDEDETTEGTVLSEQSGDSIASETLDKVVETEEEEDEDDDSDTVVGDTTAETADVDQVDVDVQETGPEEDLEAASSDSSDSDSESDSDDSDTDSDSDSDSEGDSDESEDSDEEEERLEKLLQAAKITAAAKAKESQPAEEDKNDGEMVLQFDGQDKKEAPIPDIKVGQLPRPHISFTADGSAKASPSASVIPSRKDKGKGKERAPELELDNRPYERQLSKREKAAQPRKATASDLWTQIPTARRDALQQMKRDYQALALANSLDAKRFMKGSAKSNKVPETFAIGSLVEQPRHLQDTTLTRDARYRPGQIVQEVARDELTNTTAKRKYGDLQSKRMDNGRGRGWKKRTKW